MGRLRKADALPLRWVANLTGSRIPLEDQPLDLSVSHQGGGVLGAGD